MGEGVGGSVDVDDEDCVNSSKDVGGGGGGGVTDMLWNSDINKASIEHLHQDKSFSFFVSVCLQKGSSKVH